MIHVAAHVLTALLALLVAYFGLGLFARGKEGASIAIGVCMILSGVWVTVFMLGTI